MASRKAVASSKRNKKKKPSRKREGKVVARKGKAAAARLTKKKVASRRPKPKKASPVGRRPRKVRAIKKKASVRRPRNRAVVRKKQEPKHHRPLPLKKFHKNTTVKPHEKHNWDSQYPFHPAAVHADGRVHLVYRAIGNSGISVLGYASTEDGLQIDERLDEPIYIPRQPFEYNGTILPDPNCAGSGGGFGGCEDPRITEIDGRCYMTYTAFNGYPRVAITSIATEEFLKKNRKWKPAVLISAPGEVHKNWVIFPEKIRGKYAVLHSISPEILIDYFDNLDFDGSSFIWSYHSSYPAVGRKAHTDCPERCVGPPPLKTKGGWLVIYHAIDDRDPGRYKMRAMVLDYKNPEHVLYRSAGPILEPDARYENEGFKSGVVYSCGAVIKDGTLFVYYGGADTVTCVATANLDKFLDALKSGSAHMDKRGALTKKRDARR
jgi:predicted GH43/DUF377 family glycosyl hydrolase